MSLNPPSFPSSGSPGISLPARPAAGAAAAAAATPTADISVLWNVVPNPGTPYIDSRVVVSRTAVVVVDTKTAANPNVTLDVTFNLGP